MADYSYPDDGKIHTRFSEILRCTDGQIDRVVAEHRNPGLRVETPDMQFGTARHEMWAEESRLTGMVPACFQELEGFHVPVTHVEEEFTTEIAPGIVVHSRPDSLCAPIGRVNDYKTVIDGVRGFEANLGHYRTSKQGRFYVFQLAVHNLPFREIAYLCEIWDVNREKILGYRSVVQRPRMLEVAAMRDWAIRGASLLKVALTRDTPMS